MWVLDDKEGWAPKNWCFQTAVLEKILEGLLDSKEVKLVSPKGNQPWIFIEGLMLKLHLMRRVNSLKKTLMLGKIEGSWRRGWQRMRWLDSITNSMDVNLSKQVGIWLWSWSGSAARLPQCSLLTWMHQVSLFSPYDVGLIAYLTWPEKLLMKSWVGKSISAALVPMLAKWELVFLIREKEQDLGAFKILNSFKFCL